MTALRGGPCEKIGKLRGGHAIYKWCFPNPTSPPSLVKNERSLSSYKPNPSLKKCHGHAFLSLISSLLLVFEKENERSE